MALHRPGRLAHARTALRLRAATRPRSVVLIDVHGELTAGDLQGHLQLLERRGAERPRLGELPPWAPLRQVLVTALAGHGHLDLRSSGTTGAPRVLERGPLTAPQLRTLTDLARRIGVRRGARVATAIPGVHAHGLLLALAALSAGSPLVDVSHLRVVDRVALLHRTSPRMLVGTPVHLADILAADRELSGHVPLRIDRIVSTTDVLPDELRADLARHWHARVHDVYGSVETGTLTVDGRPLHGVEIRVRDGVLRTRTSFTRRRWLVTDHGEIDEQGSVHVTARADAPDASPGMLRDPRGVVRLLQSQDGIRSVHLRFVPDEELGRRTVAHVVLEEEEEHEEGRVITPHGVRALVRDRLGASSVPREVRISSRGR
ncbi:AMP-binding protein [Brachybacterium rhamnosum]|uniref:AMP-binding protein n=1 Tax=Brachybacterium rhamnosum TaxID=173361 RepID=A0ABW4PVX8_9MICO